MTANDNRPGSPATRGGPEHRRLVLVTIASICASTALVTDSTLLIVAMTALVFLSVRQMIEDEMSIALKPFISRFSGNLAE